MRSPIEDAAALIRHTRERSFPKAIHVQDRLEVGIAHKEMLAVQAALGGGDRDGSGMLIANNSGPPHRQKR